MDRRLQIAVCVIVSAVTASANSADEDLVILPQQIHLGSKESRQKMVAQWRKGEAFEGQAVGGVAFGSSVDGIVQVVEGQASPVGNGKAWITGSADGKAATAKVTVSGVDQPFQWSFRNHVESVLSKQGCNGGAWLGARARQKG